MRLRSEIRNLNARGNSDLVLKAIQTAITDWEVQHYSSTPSGGGLAGGTDPRRNLPPARGGGGGGNGGYVGDGAPPPGPCHTCGELHWHRDCP